MITREKVTYALQAGKLNCVTSQAVRGLFSRQGDSRAEISAERLFGNIFWGKTLHVSGWECDVLLLQRREMPDRHL
jgi:hypothetical protein